MRLIATPEELRSIQRSVAFALCRRMDEACGIAKHEDKILAALIKRVRGTRAKQAALLEWAASDARGNGKRRLLRRLGAGDLQYQFDVYQALGCFRILVSLPNYKDIPFSAAPPIMRAMKSAVKRSDFDFFRRVGEILLGKSKWKIPTELPKLDAYLLSHWVDKNAPLYNLTMKEVTARCERELKLQGLSPGVIDKTRARLGLPVLRRRNAR